MWSTQLQQSIDNCSISIAEKNERKQSIIASPSGRVLVELLNLPHVGLRAIGSPPHTVTVSLGRHSETFETDATKGELRLHTQFPFSSTDGTFSVSLFQKKVFRPDIAVLEPASVSLKEVISECTRHKGPILKTLPLRRKSAGQKNTESIVVKFAVQLFMDLKFSAGNYW